MPIPSFANINNPTIQAALAEAEALEPGIVLNDHYSTDFYFERRAGYLGRHPQYAHRSNGLFELANEHADLVYGDYEGDLSVQEVRRREITHEITPFLPFPTTGNVTTIDSFGGLPDSEWAEGNAGVRVLNSPTISELSRPVSPVDSPRDAAEKQTKADGDLASGAETDQRSQRVDADPSPERGAATRDASQRSVTAAGLGHIPEILGLLDRLHPAAANMPAAGPASATTQASAGNGAEIGQAAPAAASTASSDVSSASGTDVDARPIITAGVGAGRGRVASYASRATNVPVKVRKGSKRALSGPGEGYEVVSTDGEGGDEPDDSEDETASPPPRKMIKLNAPRPEKKQKPASKARKTRAGEGIATSAARKSTASQEKAKPSSKTTNLDAIVDGTALPRSKAQARAADEQRHALLLTAHNNAPRARKTKGQTEPDLMPEYFNTANFPPGQEGDQVRCVCGAVADDGLQMLCCDECDVWQHTACVGQAAPRDVEQGSRNGDRSSVMPSTSPGGNDAPTTSTPFEQILPGRPITGVQSLTTFTYRHKRYVAYISGGQLNILSSPTALVQAITFSSSSDPEALISIVSDPKNGKLAVATKKAVWVLEPITEGWTKIWWERVLHLMREDAGDEASWLDWGNDGELLVGGSRQLSLFSTMPSSRSSSPAVPPSDGGRVVQERRSLWSKAVSSPLRWAAFSPSANLIATCGERDRLVKIWRRLSFEEGLFDHTYLPHPGAVTHLQWRPLEEGFEERRGSGKSGRHDDDPEVLHTIANDGVLRVWRTGGIHDMEILVLHTTVDLVSAIPQSPSLTLNASASVPTAKSARYAFILPAFHFTATVKAAIGLQAPDAKLSYSLEHLKEVSSKEPDIIITLDGYGRMSAWGLQSIGHKRRPETPSGLSKQAFHIAHCEDLPIRFGQGENARFEFWFDDAMLNVVSHAFDGEIKWWRGGAEAFFSPAAGGEERLQEATCWCGFDGPSGNLRTLANPDGSTALVSYALKGNMGRWSCDAASMVRLLHSTESGQCLRGAVPVQSGRSVLVEGDGLDVVLRDNTGRLLASNGTGFGGSSVGRCSAFTSVSDHRSSQRFVILGTEDGERDATASILKGIGFTFTIAPGGSAFEDMMRFQLSDQLPGYYELPLAAILDPQCPDRFGVVGATVEGQLLLYHVEVSTNETELEPVLVTTLASGVVQPKTWTVSNDFAALVSENERQLTIVDLRDGYVEHRETFANPIFKELAYAEKANVLAIGFKTHIEVLAQGRYDRGDHRPTWHHVKQISIAGTGTRINGLAWLASGALAIAAGNGLAIAGKDVQAQELHFDVREALDVGEKASQSLNLFELSERLHKPLPFWHPKALLYFVYQGRWSLAVNLVDRLLEKLKFWSEGELLDPQLHMPSEQLYNAKDGQAVTTFSAEVVTELHQQLDEKDLPQISRAEQAHLGRVLDAMLFCAEHVKGLDNCALRFLFAWKLAALDSEVKAFTANGMTSSHVSADTLAPRMHWREISLAHQSATQQPLLDILTNSYNDKISWRTARDLGLFAWLSDQEALTRIFEALAQSAYRASSPPDPINASLYFLALHKKSTLLGLWRIATWHKEQRATMSFLRRDFAVEANRTAARKNAYALMGKRRFEYAAAFFLLAEDAASATSVLAGQCGDIMLAIAVARLYAGDGSPVLRRLVEDRLLPDAVKEGNRWQMSWCHSVLLEKAQAAEVLVKPLDGVRRWEMDDPHTLTLYKHLRKTESEWEWEAVLRGARLLRKMGLWLAALEVVRSWEFKDPREAAQEQARAETNGIAGSVAPASILDESASPVPPSQTPSMLDDFASTPAPQQQQEAPSMLDGFMETSPQQDGKTSREAKAAELLKQLKAQKAAKADVLTEKKVDGKRQPTQYKEPDANSLLDSFGF